MLEIATADLLLNDFHLETGRVEEKKIVSAETVMKVMKGVGEKYLFSLYQLTSLSCLSQK